MKIRAADTAYNEIRQGLLTGRWAPGARLRETELASELKMSRIPVREALKRLASEFLLDFKPHLGATVPDWSREDHEEIFVIRINLEGLAAELAAQRATPSEIKELEDLGRAMIGAGDRREIVRLTELNQRFHRLIGKASGNRRLLRLVDLVTEVPIVFRTFARFDDTAMRRSLMSHLELVEALRARDGVWAKAVMRAHLGAGRKVMLSALLQEMQEKGKIVVYNKVKS
jgi:DNA-binding GntR family transcriptional regulator